MKTSRIIVLFGFVAMACSPDAVPPSEGASTTGPRMTSEIQAASGSVSGQIASVNPSSRSIDLKDVRSGEMTTILVDEKTTIVVDGKSAEVEDLKVGQLAVATTRKEQGKTVASSISVRSNLSRSGSSPVPDANARARVQPNR